MKPSMHFSRSALPARQFWLACWLALALLSFQTLAHLHRHAHAHGSSGQIAALDSMSSVSTPTLLKLDRWGHQQGDLSCQLFDQLGQDHAPVAPCSVDTQAAEPALPAATLWTNGSSPIHWKRGARGPPLLS